LKENKFIDDSKINEIRNKISYEVNDAVKYAIESKRPNKDDVTNYVFRKKN
jgi:TPP-dependent pyruvate/acetoin dehydrogenase alpha subunit